MRVADGIATAVVAAEQLTEAVSALQADGYDLLVDLFAYDTPERASRFDVVYLFHRLADNARTRVKVQVGEDQEDGPAKGGCGKQQPVIGTAQQPNAVRHDQPDKADEAADRNRRDAQEWAGLHDR